MTTNRPRCSCHAPNDNTPEGEHAPDCARELWSAYQLGFVCEECETCHRTRPGRWLDADDGSGEWFTCYDCEPYDPEKE